MIALAEALIILNLNFILSAQLLLILQVLLRHWDSIHSEIEEELIEDFCKWLTSAVDVKCKLDFKTLQTMKSGARTLSRSSQDTDSDENSNDQRAPQTTARERIRQQMATKGNTTARQGEDNDEYVIKRLVRPGKQIESQPYRSTCHVSTGQDEMIPLQHIAAELIQQSVDAEFHTIFDVQYTNSSTVDMQGTMYLKALVIRLWDLNSAAITTQQQ